MTAAGNQPDFRAIADLRKKRLWSPGTVPRVLRLTLETGGDKLGRVVLDLSKVNTNASKHKAMSSEHMKETEKLLCEQVRRLLRQVEATDHRRWDTDRQSDKLAEELRRRKAG